MQLLVMDLTRSMSIPTWDGYLYALVIVKMSCCYTVGHLLKEKEKISIAIQDIIAMMEHQSGLNDIIHKTTILYFLE